MIDNENLDFFFEHDWPEYPSYTLFSNAFRRIGATEAAACIDDAVGMFPGRSPHLDRDLRRTFMASEKEKSGVEVSPIEKLGWRITALGGKTMMQLAAYIHSHIEGFPSAKKFADQCVAPNGGPATPIGNSEITEEPPSVS